MEYGTLFVGLCLGAFLGSRNLIKKSIDNILDGKKTGDVK